MARPDKHLHMIIPTAQYGFPRGDAQVSTDYWLILFLHTRHPSRYLYRLIISNISISRVYLGVQSFPDVIASIGVGTITVLMWQLQEIISKVFGFLISFTS
ncbi:MAG: hypothetical protein VYC40_02805 [Pseudomonadota bacterium]|nr:hypothetical protein [Pseudomonadota bacterium]